LLEPFGGVRHMDPRNRGKVTARHRVTTLTRLEPFDMALDGFPEFRIATICTLSLATMPPIARLRGRRTE
jgi:hypothetical protein